MDQEKPFIHIIPLWSEYLHAPYISDTLIQCIEAQKRLWNKTLIFYNRRWSARAYICKECGHYDKCPHCDIALAYHESNGIKLICHQCSSKQEVPISCSHCQGTHFIHVWVGIQRIENDLSKILWWWYSILRIDSDKEETTREIYESIDDYDVILATNRAISLTHPKIAIIIFLIFEINLSIPEYDIEEITYAEIAHLKRQKKPLYIQTYMPDHPLLEEIVRGNYRSFMEYTKKERATFLYPPFTELATIRIHDENKERVKTIVANLVNKIQLSAKESTKIAYDTDIWEKIRSEWTQKIVLRDKNLEYMINLLEVEIVRNRAVTLEWH